MLVVLLAAMTCVHGQDFSIGPIEVNSVLNNNTTIDDANPTFSGAPAPRIYSIISGPAWLSLSQAGTVITVSGTPRNFNIGINNFVIQASNGTTDTATLQITVVKKWKLKPVYTQALSGVLFDNDTLFSGNYLVTPLAANIDYDSPAGIQSGPLWLTLDQAGAPGTTVDLMGTPVCSDVGENLYIVRADDGSATFDVPMYVDVFPEIPLWYQEYTGDNPNTVRIWHMDASEDITGGPAEFGKFERFDDAVLDPTGKIIEQLTYCRS